LIEIDLNAHGSLDCLQLLGLHFLGLGRGLDATAASVVSTVVLIVLLGLAIVRPRVVVAIMIIEMQSVCTGWIRVQVQEAIPVVVAVWLAVARAAKPPWGSI